MDLSIEGRSFSIGCSSRVLDYYTKSEGVVPFKWEMQPGTPLEDPPKYEALPPLSPPPALLSLGLPTPNINIEDSTTNLKPSFRKRLLMFLKHKKKKNQAKKEATNENHGSFNDDVHHFFEIRSTDEGSSSRSNYSSSSSSLSSFSNGTHFMKSSSFSTRSQQVPVEVLHYGAYTCSPLNFYFTSALGHIARLV